MNYADGHAVALGDIVAIAHDVTGTVVLLIEDGVGDKAFPSGDWAYLGQGILVQSQEVGLIHYPDLDEYRPTLVSRLARHSKP